MDGLFQAHKQQEKRGNLSKAIEDVQELVELLQNARDAVATDPTSATKQLRALKEPVKKSFAKVEDDLKEVNRGLNQYQKALKDKFKNAVLPTAPSAALNSQPNLINRAIAMHLLREGKFDVAKTFVKEVNENPSINSGDTAKIQDSEGKNWLEGLADPDDTMQEAFDTNPGGSDVERGGLQKKFTEMYHILDALRNHRNLEPAIEWARQHSGELERRGSNLEFELSRLKFVELYQAGGIIDSEGFAGPIRAMEYARSVFPSFNPRYAPEISRLVGSLAFSPELGNSPYQSFFTNIFSFEEASTSFTREFCGMLGLSSQSPLFTAVTAGSIALPVLEKVERVMAQARGQWTSVNELPVETPLPPGFSFHSIFVCPVSKEQATDANPPMMLPCGHVIAKESLEMHSRGKQKMKCPYCPLDYQPREAKRIYI